MGNMSLQEKKMEQRHDVLKANVAHRKQLLAEDQKVLADFEKRWKASKKKVAKKRKRK